MQANVHWISGHWFMLTVYAAKSFEVERAQSRSFLLARKYNENGFKVCIWPILFFTDHVFSLLFGFLFSVCALTSVNVPSAQTKPCTDIYGDIFCSVLYLKEIDTLQYKSENYGNLWIINAVVTRHRLNGTGEWINIPLTLVPSNEWSKPSQFYGLKRWRSNFMQIKLSSREIFGCCFPLSYCSKPMHLFQL